MSWAHGITKVYRLAQPDLTPPEPDAADLQDLRGRVGEVEDQQGLMNRMDTTCPARGDYRATAHGLVWLKPTNNGRVATLLTNFTATITAQIVEDDGADTHLRFALTAQRQGETSCFEIPAAQFASMGWVTEHLGAQAILMPGMTLRDHARAAIQILSQNIARRRVYTHLGWCKLGERWYYLHADGAIGAQGQIDDIAVALGQALTAYRLPPPLAGEARCAAIRASLALLDVAPDSVTIPLYGAIWRVVLGDVDGSLHLVGPTGQGKTALAALAQQHCGAGLDARHLPASWTSTGNALEGIAFQAKDTVLVVDDFCPTGSQADIARYHRDADRLLRAQGNRSGRQRMRADSTLRPMKPPRGLILSTGEDIPRGHSLRARVFILDVSPGMVDWERLTACQGDADTGVYAQALAGFVHWLAPRYGEVIQGLPAELRALRQQAVHGGHRRTPDMVANLAVGMQYLLAYAHDCGALALEECRAYWERAWQALGDAAAAQDEHQAGEEPTSRFLTLLTGAIAGGHAHVADAKTLEHPTNGSNQDHDSSQDRDPMYWGWRERTIGTGDNARDEWHPLGPCIGWVHDTWLYLEPEAAFHTVQRFAEGQQAPLSITQRTLWKRMGEHGMLVTQPSQRQHTVSRDIGPDHKSKRVLAMSVALLAPGNSISSMQGSNSQKNKADWPHCFPAWYATKQYATSDTISMPDHAVSPPNASEEGHTVFTPDLPTDFGEGTVGKNEPQLLEKSVPYTVHTDHTVFQDNIGAQHGEEGISCPPHYTGPPPRGVLMSGRWVWLYQQDGSPRYDRPVQIRRVRHLDGQTDIQWAPSPTEELRWHDGRLCVVVARETQA